MKSKTRIILFILFLFPFVAMAKGKREVWVIDAGHGGRDVGCEGSKAKEKDINLAVALRVAELVRANISGVTVKMTRDTDRFVSLDGRATFANNAGANLFLSIHVNAVPEASNIRGTETYYGPIGATNSDNVEYARKRYIQKSELLAWEMQKQYGLVGRPISRGVKRERYYVILYTQMPSILTEIGFISTPSEQEYMTSRAGQEEIAQCIYRGLKEYKETVDAGKEKRVLAEMRRTGGRVAGTTPKPDEALLAKNDKAASDTAVQPTSEGKDVAQVTPTAASTAKQTTTSNNTTAAKTNGKTPIATKTEAVAVAQKVQTETTDTVLDPTLEPELDSDALSFGVQILVSRSIYKGTDARFKGLKGVRMMEKDGKYKYLVGQTDNYADARKLLVDVRQVFPDAFLVAFLGTRQISTSDAQELYIKKK